MQVKLPVFIWQEKASWVAWTPALDLSSCGSSEKEVKSNFAEAVDIFFEEALEDGVLDQLLTSFGWEKSESRWMPVAIAAQANQAMMEFALPVQ